MSKLFNFYANDVDKAWYSSSNIKYSECIDKEGQLKVLKVVFSNGTQYQYNGVNVQDYLMFRENESQGKALNKFIKAKGYEFEKLDNADRDAINEEYSFRTGKGAEIESYDGGIRVYDSQRHVLCDIDLSKEQSYEGVIKQILESVGYIVKEQDFESGDSNTKEKE